MKTFFAVPERVSDKKLKEEIKLFNDTEVFKEFSSAIQSIFMILNNKRQIVFMNSRFLELLELNNREKIYGTRPGEILGCIHSDKMKGGCGTSEACKECGAVKAILRALEGVQAFEDCRIRTHNNKAFDLRVIATPYKINDEIFSVVSVFDISNEKRRKSLEKIFFHDVLNSAGGISSLSELLLDSTLEKEDIEVIKLINNESSKLIQEIKYQKDMNSAEEGDLQISYQKKNIKELIEELVGVYRNHVLAKDKVIEIDGEIPDIGIITDIVLLRRVLGNMIKNALEAVKKGQRVIVLCTDEGKYVKFAVNNTTYIERDIQLQIFQRSFSTKGEGRGLGTYSMKLLGENYLKGKVYFKSDKNDGTTFFFEVPKAPPFE